MTILTETALFGGTHLVIKHDSDVIGAPMELAIYIPPAGLNNEGPLPCLTYLSGLTCTWENAATKAGAQAHAAKAGMVLVFPDTSPRGSDIAEAEDVVADSRSSSPPSPRTPLPELSPNLDHCFVPSRRDRKADTCRRCINALSASKVIVFPDKVFT